MWASTSYSTQETLDLGIRMGKRLAAGTVIALQGDLGAGKTLITKGIAQGAAGVNPGQVQSPTFIHLNIYEGTRSIYHFDLYRLRDSDAFLSMGFDDYFFTDGICCIEWSERIEPILPKTALKMTLTHLGGDLRRIEIPLSQAAALWMGNVSSKATL